MTDAARGLDLPALSAAGFGLVVLLPVPVWALARFVREALPHSPDLAARLFADEGAAAYAALGCTFRFSTAKLKPDTIHAHTPVWKAALWGSGEGLRGGPQGDYAAGMPEKLQNVINALQRNASTDAPLLVIYALM